jgi:hypothetical protein
MKECDHCGIHCSTVMHGAVLYLASPLLHALPTLPTSISNSNFAMNTASSGLDIEPCGELDVTIQQIGAGGESKFLPEVQCDHQ